MLLLILGFIAYALGVKYEGTVYYNGMNFEFVEKYDVLGAAYGYFHDELHEKGWDRLIVHTNPKYTDFIQAEAVGYLEGVLTAKKIWDNFENLQRITWSEKTNFTMPEDIQRFFTQQREFMREMVFSGELDGYKTLVGAMYYQEKGLLEGYNTIAANDKDLCMLTYEEFQVISSAGDIFDLLYMNKENRKDFDNMGNFEIEEFIRLHTHCSALFKLTHDHKELMFGHNSWAQYSRTLRIFKEYNLNYASANAKTIMCSSYPGMINSFDDYYITSQDLAIIETTNNIFNTSLYDVLSPRTLLYWQRVMVASRIAKNGKEWAETFERYNSGSYNNQWMILDLKKYQKGENELKDGTFYVLEQIPGRVVWKDQSKILENGYWPSYNIPFYKSIWLASGYQEQQEKHPEIGYLFSYEECPRATIFRRDQVLIDDMESFKHMMRYNDYKNDKLSRGDPAFAIASRYDLRGIPKTPACDGAYDAKICSYSMWKDEKKIQAINGPTHEASYIDFFDFSSRLGKKVCPEDKFPRNGIPEKLDFDWIDIENSICEKK